MILPYCLYSSTVLVIVHWLASLASRFFLRTPPSRPHNAIDDGRDLTTGRPPSPDQSYPLVVRSCKEMNVVSRSGRLIYASASRSAGRRGCGIGSTNTRYVGLTCQLRACRLSAVACCQERWPARTSMMHVRTLSRYVGLLCRLRAGRVSACQQWPLVHVRTLSSSSGGNSNDEDKIDDKVQDEKEVKEADAQPSTEATSQYADDAKIPASSDDDQTTSVASTSSNPALALPFPWHHSPGERLARLDENDDLSGLPKTDRARFLRKTLAARELGVKWYQIFLTGSWEKELADNFAWAFRRSVAGLLSKTFDVPMDTIDVDDDDGELVKIDTTATTSTKSTSDGDAPAEVADDDNNNSIADVEKMTDADREEAKALVEAMLEENLLALYQNIDPTKIHIKFSMRPISWRFESAFLIPMFTRQHVKRDPSLRGAYQAIETEFVDSGSVAKVREMGEKLNKQVGGSGQRSLIAEVSVDCLEFLQVYDVDTGEIIQGDDEDGGEKEREVQHLVRMEMATTRGAEGGRMLGSWQVIDIDDLLEGNVWH